MAKFAIIMTFDLLVSFYDNWEVFKALIIDLRRVISLVIKEAYYYY